LGQKVLDGIMQASTDQHHKQRQRQYYEG